MINSIIDVLRTTALKHKAVNTFKYQSSVYNNSQNNYKNYQIYVDDVTMSELNITTNIFKVTLDIYILSTPYEDKPVIEVQTDAYTIACDMMAYIDTRDEYDGIMSIYDYSILTLSNYTDDNSAGVKLTLVISVPNPVNLCEFEENFEEDMMQVDDEERDITLNDYPQEDKEITLNQVKLPKNKRC